MQAEGPAIVSGVSASQGAAAAEQGLAVDQGLAIIPKSQGDLARDTNRLIQSMRQHTCTCDSEGLFGTGWSLLFGVLVLRAWPVVNLTLPLAA